MKDFAKPYIIAGPCSAETRAQTIETCKALAATGMVGMLRAGVWKPRTKPGSFEGTGVRGLAWMAEARRITGLPFAVEAATTKHVENALRYGADALWIGARTTVSPFAVQEIADALRGTASVTVLIKNPVNPDIGLWGGAVERIAAAVGIGNIVLSHRGFSYFGETRYRNSPMWHIAFGMRANFPGLPMICDPSHIGGDRTYIREIAQTAADLCYDGLMIESHCRPGDALSDAAQQVTPEELETILRGINWRRAGIDDPKFDKILEKYRAEIDLIDEQLFGLLSRRMEIADRIGIEKRENHVAILQGGRWNTIVSKVLSKAAELNLSEEFIKTVLEAIHIESINRQNNVMNR